MEIDQPILNVLTWCFLALLYVFFFRVLQAVWRGSTTRVSVNQVNRSATTSSKSSPGRPQVTAFERTGKPSSNSPDRVTVLQPASLAGQEYKLEGELGIGRAATCAIRLDDSFISQLHARIIRTADGVVVEDLGSTNGTFLNNEKLYGAKKAQLGDRIRIGNVLMEMR